MNALVSEMKALLVLIEYFRHINNMFEIISADLRADKRNKKLLMHNTQQTFYVHLNIAKTCHINGLIKFTKGILSQS